MKECVKESCQVDRKTSLTAIIRTTGGYIYTPHALLPPLSTIRQAAVTTFATLLSLSAPTNLQPKSGCVTDFETTLQSFTSPETSVKQAGRPSKWYASSHATVLARTVVVKPRNNIKWPWEKLESQFGQNLIDPVEEKAERDRRRILDEAWDLFSQRFIDDQTINWHRLRCRLETRPLRTDRQLERTLHWLFAQTDDPFTRYLPFEQLEAVKGDIDGEMCGVGIIFSAERQGLGGHRRVVIIKHVVRDSPAAEAGLQKGDRITAIDLVDVDRMTFDEATTRLLGKQGKKVLISFCRGTSAELSILLTRRKFEVPTVSAERVYVPDVGDVGYIHVREFASNTAGQTRKAVRQVYSKGPVVAMVLDLRGNAGGLVDRAVQVAKLFLKQDQVVVRFIGRGGEVTTERCTWGLWSFWHSRMRQSVTDSPMVVLVDSETASASEIVAAALKDNCRAVVVGNSTFGKGSVQAIMPLSNGAGAAITVARYQTPRGKNIHAGKGLRPDLFKSELGDEGDEAVLDFFGQCGQRRLKWIASRLSKCTPTDFDKHNR